MLVFEFKWIIIIWEVRIVDEVIADLWEVGAWVGDGLNVCARARVFCVPDSSCEEERIGDDGGLLEVYLEFYREGRNRRFGSGCYSNKSELGSELFPGLAQDILIIGFKF